jgi:hypothetical protein
MLRVYVTCVVTKPNIPGLPKKQKNNKIENNHNTITQGTPIFKWFGLTSLHPLAETIQEKFTNKKDEVQRIVQTKPLKPKNSNTPKSHEHTKLN